MRTEQDVKVIHFDLLKAMGIDFIVWIFPIIDNISLTCTVGSKFNFDVAALCALQSVCG